LDQTPSDFLQMETIFERAANSAPFLGGGRTITTRSRRCAVSKL
jgi:hypothetical protein